MYYQLAFNLDIKIKKKRIRYKKPTYNKFYSIWQYDRDLFKFFIAKRKKGLINYSQDIILEKCFLRDENGKKQRDTDEKHIFRIRNLHKIHNYLYTVLGYEETENKDKPIIINGVKIHFDECQAEIINTWQFAIKDRIILHIALLKKILVYTLALARLIKEYDKENEN